MARYIYDEISGQMISVEEYHFKEFMKKAHLHMTKPNSNERVNIYYNSDQMEPTRHMASGKMFTSKKKFRDETKAYGCIEVGNETKHMLKPRKPAKLDRRKRRESIKKAINDLKYGNVPKAT